MHVVCISPENMQHNESLIDRRIVNMRLTSNFETAAYVSGLIREKDAFYDFHLKRRNVLMNRQNHSFKMILLHLLSKIRVVARTIFIEN